jgi:hypothetical protein
MRQSLKIVFIVLLATLTLSACTTYERKVTPFKMPEAYPNAATAAGASIAAKAYYDKEEATETFGFDIRGAGILPVQVVFDNKGSHPLEIVAGKTFLVDEGNNLWPILEQGLAYDRLTKATQLGKVIPEAGKGGLLGGAAGAVIGAAIGIVTGTSIGEAAGKGAAVGAAAGLTLGGTKGMADSDVRDQIQEDLQNRSLTTRAIAPHELAHGFIFYPGEAKRPKELRISIKATDTKEVFPLTLRL